MRKLPKFNNRHLTHRIVSHILYGFTSVSFSARLWLALRIIILSGGFQGGMATDIPLTLSDNLQTVAMTDAMVRRMDHWFTFTETINNLADARSVDLAIADGPRSVGTGTDDSSFGTVAWSNPGNVTASDDSRATVVLLLNEESHYLKAVNFGFSIPSNAVIKGIGVEVEASALTLGADITDIAVRIVKNNSIGTTDRTSTVAWSTSDTYRRYGGAADLWGDTWTAADINIVNFGFAIAVKAAAADSARIDHIRLTVYYALPIIELTLADDLNGTLADAKNVALGLPQTATDDLNTWSDGGFILIRPRWLDSHSLIEEHRKTFAEDSNNLSDSFIPFGFGLVLAGENANNLADAYAQELESEGADLTLSLNDDLNTPWADALTKTVSERLPLILSDSAPGPTADALSHFRATRLTRTVTDNLRATSPMTDAAVVRIGRVVIASDNADNLADAAVTPRLGDIGVFADTINNWGDGGFVAEKPRWLDAFSWEAIPFIPTPLDIIVSDNLNNWNDGGFAWLKNTWKDAESHQLIVPPPSDPLTVSDNFVVANWTDEYHRDYIGHLVPDDLNEWDDALATFVGVGLYLSGLADNLVGGWGDSIQIVLGHAIQVADDLNTWNDSVTINEGQLFGFNDNLNNLNDNCGLGYGNHCQDDVNFLADSLTLVEGQHLSFSDSLNNWNDDVVIVLGYILVFSDDLNDWNDSLSFSVGQPLSFSDNTNNFNDSLILGYGLNVPADDLNSWNDTLPVVLGYHTSFADDLNAWGDLEVHILEDGGTTKHLMLEDNLNAWGDTLHLGYGLGVPGDSLNNWTDDLGTILGYHTAFSDNLNNWNDSISVGLGFVLVLEDNLGSTLNDSVALVEGQHFTFNDNLNNWNDQLAGNLHYLSTLTDDLDSWDDFVDLDIVDSQYDITAADNLNNWADAYGFGYGGNIAPDSLDLWNDDLAVIVGQLLVLSDNANGTLNDSLRLGYGLIIVETINNLNDNEAHEITLGLLTLTLNDNLNNFADNITGIGYGLVFNEVFTLADDEDHFPTGAELSKGFVEDLNNWNDSIFIQSSNIDLVCADAFGPWRDRIELGFKPTALRGMIRLKDDFSGSMISLKDSYRGSMIRIKEDQGVLV